MYLARWNAEKSKTIISQISTMETNESNIAEFALGLSFSHGQTTESYPNLADPDWFIPQRGMVRFGCQLLRYTGV